MLRVLLVMVEQIISQFSSFGFEGSRSSGAAVLSAQAVFPFVPSGAAVCTGCAAGVDAATRKAFPECQVFSVSDFNISGIGRASFAIRSAALVQSVAASSGLLLAFPSTACPAAVKPSRSFAGHGSGSWGSAALSVGLGAATLICIPDGCAAPAWLVAIGQPLEGSGFWFVPARPALF